MTVLSDRVDALEATNANLVTILQGLQGTLQDAVDAGQGPQGWSPVLTVQSDGARRVLQVTDWTGGGTGATKPDTGDYIGESGLEPLIGDAIDIRGDTGADGNDGADGTGWTGATYDSGTGVITFTSDDGLGFATDDLRGEKGDPGAMFDWTGPWVTSTAYTEGQGVENDGSSYVCTSDHTSGVSTEPGVGGSWQTVWDLSAAKGDPGAGSGDMQASTYDPQSIEGDAFDRANHTGTQTLSTISDAGTAAANDTGDFATAAQGALANTATQPGDLATVATSGDYADLTGKPTLGTAAAADTGDFATAAQGATADTAVQPGDDAGTLGSGAATDGQVLTADGAGNAAWEDAGGGGGGLVFLASSDLSSDATADFTAFDAGLYDAIEFVFQNIIPATDDVDFSFLSSTDSGSTWDNTSGDYDFGCIMLRSGTVFDTDSGNAASIALTGTGAFTIGNTSGYPGLSGRLLIPGPHLAKKTQFLWNTSFYDPSGNLVMLNGSGLRQSEADVDAVRFFCSSGNIASGTITMYGMVNA